ncbi:hypothetical protein EDB92DRAFT_1894446 [Lactarius akahatsu]|uniref:DUF6535 domain-containing protein n=1 Tax=Lactarius akahatsu TaxID=416441 RepID=A0AAD4Q955_9AGAM|nr:hypothetical protein EDB92DRAFT_1894446 [Lactarius akahatsu]
MASTSVDPDVEAQIQAQNSAMETIIANPLPTINTANPQLPTSTDHQPQVTNTDEHQMENVPAPQAMDNSQVQRDESHGDSSDGLWSMYLDEAGKQDTEVTESWKGDTEGILVFTGLFSATVAAFIIESYKKLSPDSSDTTNALLSQISVQLVNISNGTPLASVTAKSGQPFQPTASAVRVNVLWFISLIPSLSCALSATLMQQWARRYQELAQRRGAFHKRGRMRAYIFDGVQRFGMARAVATMPTLLHASVFLFFAGLVDFLFPIHTTVAYAALCCIVVFALAYAILTALPNIYLDCPYGTLLSRFTWRIYQFSVFGFLWTILEIQRLYHKSLLKLWGLANQHASETHGSKKWWEILGKQVEIRRQRFSQSLRKSVELSAYRAKSTVVTSALEWTLTALDEEGEIEDFAARVPGFFDSRVVPDATSAVLSLMSHQPDTDPIFGSRLFDLLKTCLPGTSPLDKRIRKNRLRVCLKCLWYFGRAYNQLGDSQMLPSFIPNFLARPEITRRVQAEGDPAVRVIGSCFTALIVNKLTSDLKLRTDPITDGELACLSAVLGTKSHDVKILLSQPGAVALANFFSLMFNEAGTLVTDTVPLDVVQQTIVILSLALPFQVNAELQQEYPIATLNGSNRKFERMMNPSDGTSSLTHDRRKRVSRMCLKSLWNVVRASNERQQLVPLPSYVYGAFTNSGMARRIYHDADPITAVIGRCVGALLVNKLVFDLKSRVGSVGDGELACLSTILDTESHDVMLWLKHPGAIELVGVVSLVLDIFRSLDTNAVPPDVLDVVQQTLDLISRALPTERIAQQRLDQTTSLISVPDSTFEHIVSSRLEQFFKAYIPNTSSLTVEVRTACLSICLKSLWCFTGLYHRPGASMPLPSYFTLVHASPEVSHLIQTELDPLVRVIGRCFEALVVDKLVADANSLTDEGVACISAILGSESHIVWRWLGQPGAIDLRNVVSVLWDEIDIFIADELLADVLEIFQQTLSIIARQIARGHGSADEDLYLDQVLYFHDIRLMVANMDIVTTARGGGQEQAAIERPNLGWAVVVVRYERQLPQIEFRIDGLSV